MSKNDLIARHMLRSGALLALFAVVTTGLVAATFDLTRERIAANERAAVLRSLHAILPGDSHDNDLLADTIQVTDRDLLGSNKPTTIYRARQGNRPVAAIISTIAPDGYGGPIKLLVGIRYDGTISGVRVVAHRETPGLGDAIDEDRSDWIKGFNGKTLANPGAKRWHVKRDNGVFDQFTGATITPRAVVKATHNALLYFTAHRDEIFAPATSGPTAEKSHE